MKRILLALDASPVSVHAAKVAARMFRGVPDVEFLALNVAAVPVAVAGDPTGGAYAIPEDVWQELEHEATDVGRGGGARPRGRHHPGGAGRGAG